MKNLIKLMVFLILVIFVGCSKERAMQQPDGSKMIMSMDDPYAYAQENLEYIAKGLPSVMNNSVFRSILSSEIGKCFDGDYNVLFNRLIEACDSANIDLLNIMKIYLHANGEDSSLFDPVGAFQGIEGNNYFPQVYIPNFSDNNWDNEESPVAITFNGDESFDVFEGYTVGTGNQYMVIPEVDDAFSFDRQVWVVSLNECVDDDGEPMEPCNPEGDRILLGDETGLYGGSQTTNVQIKKIEIKERFENWAGGRSDVAIRSYAVMADGTSREAGLGYFNSYNQEDYRGDIVKRVNKGDVGVGKEFTINYPIATNWACGNANTERIHFVHIIFERDCWPATRGWAFDDIVIGGKYQNMEVRSYTQDDRKQGYCLQYITSMQGIDNCYFNPYPVDNIYIAMNTSIYYN